MMDLRTLHSEAMDHAEKAMIDRAHGKADSAKKHLADALRKEEQAARLAVKHNAPEPTRTILLKSAAHLAVDAGNLRLAEQLVALALSGEPPDELADELRGLFDEIGQIVKKIALTTQRGAEVKRLAMRRVSKA